MKALSWRGWVGVTVALAAIPVVYYLLRPMRQPISRKPAEIRSFLNLGVIAGALSKFEYRNKGQLPEQLLDLVPGYISLEKAYVLFPPWMDRSAVTNKLTQSSLLSEGSFTYLGDAGRPIGIISYEKPELWEHAGFKDGQIYVMRTDFTSKRITFEDLDRRLSRLRTNKWTNGKGIPSEQ